MYPRRCSVIAASLLRSMSLARQLRVDRVVKKRAALQSSPIVGADPPDTLADEVQPGGGWLERHFLNGIRLVDHPSDASQDGIGEIEHVEKSVESAVSVVVREAHLRDIERFGSLRKLATKGNEEKLRVRVHVAFDEPGRAHPIDANHLPRDPLHEAP